MAEKHFIKISDIVKFFSDEEKLITRGENALESGHIINMKFDSDLRILRGSVHASMRDKQYQIEIKFNSEWALESATCSCPRGQYLCHHMACLALFGHYNISVTDTACSWSTQKKTKDEEIKKIKDMYPSKNHRSTKRDASDAEIEVLRQKLQALDGAVGFTWLLLKEAYEMDEKILVDIEDIIFSKDYLDSEDRSLYFKQKVETCQDTIHKITKLTIGQTSNERWLICKKNRLTASYFGVVVSACRRNRFPASLFKRLAGTYNMDHIKSIQWGREHEKEGITALENSIGKKVTPTGLWLHKCGYLGASPDGLIEDEAIVEVKCPYKYRENSLLEGIKKSTDYIIIADPDGNVTINKSHEYFHQIQGQLAITKRQKCYLVVWTPKEVVIIEIEKEDYSTNLETIKDFYIKHYIPFLLGEKYIN